MTKFATFDATGLPTGFYSDEAFMHGARLRPVYGPTPEPTEDNPHPLPPVIGTEPNPDCKIPPEAVELTEEQYREFIDNPGTRAWQDGQAVEYTPPVVLPPPPDLLPYQFRAMLALSGKQAALDAYIASLPDPQKTIAQAKFDYSLSFRRDNDLVESARQALGLTNDQLDVLWARAAAIT